MIFEKTKIYRLKNHKLTKEEINALINILNKGQLIVFPTETVYGLGCLYANESAKREIFDIKKREPQKKIPVMVNNTDIIESFFKCRCSLLAKDIMRKFMPGAVTVILNCEGRGSYGFRIPDNEFVLDLISACNHPLAATSANLAGGEPAVDFEGAWRLFFNKVAAIIDGGRCRLSKPSTIIDLRDENKFEIIREGVYEENLVKTALSNPKNILFVCTGNSCRSVLAMALLKKELEEKGIADVKINSAGMVAMEGMPPTRDTVEVLQEAGIEINEHRARKLKGYMLEEADLILAMERMHMDYILSTDINSKHKTFGFLKFAFGLEEIVDDPIGKGKDEYRKTFSLIEEGVKGIVKKIT